MNYDNLIPISIIVLEFSQEISYKKVENYVTEMSLYLSSGKMEKIAMKQKNRCHRLPNNKILNLIEYASVSWRYIAEKMPLKYTISMSKKHIIEG